jgi:phosphate transport system substrate-binding protein
MKKALLALTTLTGAALALEITGAGATFPYPLYSKWAFHFEKETGNRVNYQSYRFRWWHKADN